MNILYIQHVDSLPSFFPKFLDACAAPQTGLGKTTDKGWIITTESLINNGGHEGDAFNQFLRTAQAQGYQLFYTTKNPQ